LDTNEHPNPVGEPSRGLVPAGQGPAVSYDRVLAPYDPFGPHGASPAAGHAKPFSWSRILRFKGTIVLTFLLLAVPAVAAIWFFLVPKYMARGEIRVRPLVRPLVFKTDDNGLIPFYQSYLNTQVSIIYRPEVLQKVLDQKDVKATRWYREQMSNRTDAESQPWYRSLVASLLKDSSKPIEKLREDLSVSPRPATEIIDVSMTTAYSGEDAAVIVNAVLDQYLANTRNSDDERDGIYYNKLVEEEKSLRGEIEGRENLVAGLRKELGTGTPEELITQMRVRLDAAEARVASVRQDRATAEWEEQELWRWVRESPVAAADLYQKSGNSLRLLAGEIQALEAKRAQPAGQAPNTGAEAEQSKTQPGEMQAPQVRHAELAGQAATTGPQAEQPKAQADEKRPQEEMASSEGRLKELQQEFAVIEARHEELAALVKPESEKTGATSTSAVSPLPVLSLDQPGYSEDAEWRRLNLELQAALHEQAIKRLTEKHPQMAEIKKRVQFAQEVLSQREKQLDDQWQAQRKRGSVAPFLGPTTTAIAGPDRNMERELDVVTRLRNTRQRVRLLKYQEGVLLETVAKEKADFNPMFEKAQTLAKETEAIHHKRDLYAAVRTRLAQKEMERNVPGAIDVQTRAMAPSEPTSDRRILLSALALVGALTAGFGLAFRQANMNQSIHEPEDLAHATPIPFLWHLPLVPGKGRGVLEDHPGLAESFRMVRTALLCRIDLEQGNSVQITSAEPGAGKSTVAIMLAKSLAQSGKRVLLVDADLRNPALSDRFKVPLEPGFIGTLSGQVTDSEAIVETDTPRLSVLPAGKSRSGDDHELVANGAFAVCLERWRRQYDLVLLDGSPLLSVADAGIVAQRASGTVMVVRERASHRDEVLAALDRLTMSGGSLLGIIFIGSTQHGRYGYSYYNAYHAYHDDQANSHA